MRPISLLLLLLGGCDFSEDEPNAPLFASGTVVLAETGEPIEGLGVVLRATGGFGSSVFIRARTTTGAGGSFELAYQGTDNGAYTFRINDDPYNGDYRTFSRPIRAGDREDFGVIELPRTQ